MTLQFELADGAVLPVAIEGAVIAGFTGRDLSAVAAHVEELAAAGVARPTTVPTFYALPPGLVAQDEVITVTHGDTSGEVEIVLLSTPSGRYVTVGSDHTDRAAEAIDLALSKRCCPKVVARQAWPYEEVASHWDRLEVRSWIVEDGRRVLYQDGRAGSQIPPAELLELVPYRTEPATVALFCGTFVAQGGLRPTSVFSGELRDPVLERSIAFDYRVHDLALLDDEVVLS